MGVHSAFTKAKAANPYLPKQADVADDLVDRMKYFLDGNCELPNLERDLFKYAVEGMFPEIQDGNLVLNSCPAVKLLFFKCILCNTSQVFKSCL